MSDPTAGPGPHAERDLVHRLTRRKGRKATISPHVGPIADADLKRPNAKSGALRAGIFGINDGLLSNLSLIMGFTGAAATNQVVLLAGVAGLLAGAFSMAAGEYVSMRVQRELFERLLHIEAHELATIPDEEIQELAAIYELKGFPKDLAQRAATVVMDDPQIALETHAREELGLDPDELGSPWMAAFSSFVTFAIGAMIPLIPFMITSGTPAVIAAIVASGIAIFVVGASMSIFTGRSAWWSGLRMLFVGAGAASITYLVGRWLNVNTAI